MKSVIYKGNKKQDTYLYVESENDFSRVPELLLNSMGKLEKVMDLTLSKDKPLARADVAKVMSALSEQGYFLQMPDESDKLSLAK